MGADAEDPSETKGARDDGRAIDHRAALGLVEDNFPAEGGEDAVTGKPGESGWGNDGPVVVAHGEWSAAATEDFAALVRELHGDCLGWSAIPHASASCTGDVLHLSLIHI